MNTLAPLTLPSSGYQVIEGRQYVLDKYARRAIREEYGLQPPQVVTAVYRRYNAQRVTTTTEDLTTHEVKTLVEERPEVLATFFWFNGTHRVRFVLSLETLAEVRAMNAEADKALDEHSGEVVERVAKKPRKEAKLDDALAALIASL